MEFGLRSVNPELRAADSVCAVCEMIATNPNTRRSRLAESGSLNVVNGNVVIYNEQFALVTISYRSNCYMITMLLSRPKYSNVTGCDPCDDVVR